MKLLEKDIQLQIMDWLKIKGVYCWQNKSQGTFDPKKSIFRKPNNRHWINGVSDILGVTNFGVFLAIEVKRPGNKPTAEQLLFLQEIKKRGGIGIWSDSLKSTQDQLIDLLHR